LPYPIVTIYEGVAAMRGKFYLVLLVALFSVFALANLLADRYNQLTGDNIPQAIEVKKDNSVKK
jgi:hypothetical protein